ncbi:hypothetical protein [Henriciella litoralis]|uniref:hypothetical protein n=1 Tax=Henriciella litoralis TaxID=568102 RepID=UPI0009FFCA29|nr:hypothetical protein [Henriciella litoralis]
MKIRSIALAALFVVAACETTASDAPVVEAAPPTLSDAEFKSLYEAAYNANPKPGSERAYADLLARDDLSPEQRGTAHLYRALTRGVWVRDWTEAYPQCALGDLMIADTYPVSPPRKAQILKEMVYQYYRSHYFPNAPASCMENLEPAKAWLDANDPCSVRDGGGNCVSGE